MHAHTTQKQRSAKKCSSDSSRIVRRVNRAVQMKEERGLNLLSPQLKQASPDETPSIGSQFEERLLQSRSIQAKLKISQPNDKYEQEADRVADQVVAMPNSKLQCQPETIDENESVQTKPLVDQVDPLVQRKEVPLEQEEGGALPHVKVGDAKKRGFQEKLNHSPGAGDTLSESTKASMESHFGRDFSAVRIHTDSASAQMNKDIGAQAFTHGKNIYFNDGRFNPGTRSGKHLLAHELTHVVQQNPGIARKASRIPVLQTSHVPEVQGVFEWVGETVKGAWEGAKKVGSAVAKGVGNFKQKAKNLIAEKVRGIPGYSFVAALLGKDPISGKKVKSKSGLLRSVFSLVGKAKTYDQLVKANIIGKATLLVKRIFKTASITKSFITGSIKEIWSIISIDPRTWNKAANMLAGFLRTLIGRATKTGWSIVTKMPLLILEGFLILVGAPVKKIMGVLNRGKQVVLKIAEDPIGFIANLFGALKKGFFQFKNNIWKHLKSGLMGWLMGAMEGAGVQLPETWDLKGIIHLVLQVLGLTYTRIRKKVVKKLGPKGEQIVSRIETTVSFVKDLVANGPIALWERIKEKAAEIRDSAIGAVKSWVITKIITSAITKLATMFNPVGAIIQAALAIYNTVMFFIERAKQIGAVVQAVFNSIAPIAFGKVGKAANWIEKTMARTIPVILGFLARLIGLGGVSSKIKSVIRKVRKPIDKVVDKVIDWIVLKGKKLVSKAKSVVKKGAAKVKRLLFPKKEFTLGKEKHSVEAEESAAGADIIIRSYPTRTPVFIAKSKSRINKMKSPNKEKAEAQLLILEKDYKAWKKKTQDKTLYEKVANSVYELWKLLPDDNQIELSTPPSYGNLENGYGKSVTVKRLTQKIPLEGGAPGSTTSPSWKVLRKRRKGGGSYYVRGHLLNHKLGGPGKWFNLTPLTQTANNRGANSHLHKFESGVKEAVLEDQKIVNFSVIANYGRSAKQASFDQSSKKSATEQATIKGVVQEEAKIPLSLSCKAVEIGGTEKWEETIDNKIEDDVEKYEV